MRKANQTVPPPEGYVLVRLRRQTALERAGITTANVTLQRNSLAKALEKLKSSGVIFGYSEIPRKADDTFDIQVNSSLLLDARGNLRDLIELQDDLGVEIGSVSANQEADGEVDIENATGGDLFTQLVDDNEWAARLSRAVPDLEGQKDGRQSRDVQMLWGFVRDALRPTLNTARRQHLDSLVPAWDSAAPRELLLLGGTSYTVRFTNMTLLREIDELIGKLLNRFFDRARPVYVPQTVIEQVREQIG
jgi:hypothetical protein